MAEGLEGLLLGEDGETGSEQAQESESQFRARVAAAQARLAKVKKDESQSRVYDQQLSKIIASLPAPLIAGVVLMINHDVSSLTILATLSLVSDQAHELCEKDFAAHIEARADFSSAKLPDVKEARIADWWTFIFGAEHLSKLDRMHALRENQKFVRGYTKFLTQILGLFLVDLSNEDYDAAALKTLMKNYEVQIFRID